MGTKSVLLILFLIFLIVFFAQNYGLIEVRFLFWSFSTSRAIILIITFVCGAFFAWGLSFLKGRQ